MQRAARVLPGALPGFGEAVGPPPATHHPLDVLRGATAGEGEQALLGLRRRDASDRPDLRIRDLAAREGLGDARQAAERTGDADALAGGAGVEADAPGEPGGTGREAVTPAFPGVELTDEVEEAGGGGVEVRRQLGDLVAQTVEVCTAV